MPEYFLMVTIGAMLSVSTTTGSTIGVSMHQIGPLPYEACEKSAEAIRQSQNVLSAACAQRFSFGVSQSPH